MESARLSLNYPGSFEKRRDLLYQGHAPFQQHALHSFVQYNKHGALEKLHPFQQ